MYRTPAGGDHRSPSSSRHLPLQDERRSAVVRVQRGHTAVARAHRVGTATVSRLFRELLVAGSDFSSHSLLSLSFRINSGPNCSPSVHSATSRTALSRKPLMRWQALLACRTRRPKAQSRTSCARKPHIVARLTVRRTRCRITRAMLTMAPAAPRAMRYRAWCGTCQIQIARAQPRAAPPPPQTVEDHAAAAFHTALAIAFRGKPYRVAAVPSWHTVQTSVLVTEIAVTGARAMILV